MSSSYRTEDNSWLDVGSILHSPDGCGVEVGGIVDEELREHAFGGSTSADVDRVLIRLIPLLQAAGLTPPRQKVVHDQREGDERTWARLVDDDPRERVLPDDQVW